MSNYTKEQLLHLHKDDLRAIATEMQLKVRSNATKETIVYAILDYQAANNAQELPAEEHQTPPPTKSEEKTNNQKRIPASLFDDVIGQTEEVHEKTAPTTEEGTPTPPPTAQSDDTNADNADDVWFVITEDIPFINAFGEEVLDEDEQAFAPSHLIADMGITAPNVSNGKPTMPLNNDAQKKATNNIPTPSKSYSFDNLITGSGLLEVMPDGSGFLRSANYSYMPSPDDILVTAQQIKKNSLKNGDTIEGYIRVPRSGEKYYTLQTIEKVNGFSPEQVNSRIPFEHLTPLFPEEKFKLCNGTNDSISCRIVDLFTPIGKGQRALIVAQPKTGKTLLMKDIANAIARNNPNTYLIMLLIDERPEEVTDMERTVNAEVIASTFDEPASRHVKIAGMVLEKAKRMVECGQDVVIFLDSITRLARAYNTVSPTSGRILSGGVDANALQKPKRFFGAARNIEGGGSLTIIATALIDTGSKMDEVIFEEFKGTGNLELQLDRVLSNKRIFPAVNTLASSTRRDDLLHDPQTQAYMWKLRKYISEMTASESLTLIKKGLVNTKTNEEYLHSFAGSLPPLD